MVQLSRRNLLVGEAAVAAASSVPALAQPDRFAPMWGPIKRPDPATLDRIRLRHLLGKIKLEIERFVEEVQFEPNDALFRQHARDYFGMYLRIHQVDRLCIDYIVVCDETNNTNDMIQRNAWTMAIGLKTRIAQYPSWITTTVERTTIPSTQQALPAVA